MNPNFKCIHFETEIRYPLYLGLAFITFNNELHKSIDSPKNSCFNITFFAKNFVLRQ